MLFFEGYFRRSLNNQKQAAMSLSWKEQSYPGWTKVTSIMDSGCVEHVSPEDIAPGVRLEPSAKSKAGLGYTHACTRTSRHTHTLMHTHVHAITHPYTPYTAPLHNTSPHCSTALHITTLLHCNQTWLPACYK